MKCYNDYIHSELRLLKDQSMLRQTYRSSFPEFVFSIPHFFYHLAISTLFTLSFSLSFSLSPSLFKLVNGPCVPRMNIPRHLRRLPPLLFLLSRSKLKTLHYPCSPSTAPGEYGGADKGVQVLELMTLRDGLFSDVDRIYTNHGDGIRT